MFTGQVRQHGTQPRPDARERDISSCITQIDNNRPDNADGALWVSSLQESPLCIRLLAQAQEDLARA